MMIEQRPMSEVISDAINILASQIGTANTARFINYFSVGFGDYTEDRKEIFAKFTVDDIVTEIRAKKKPSKKKS
ncbi:MAG: hypothetical protein COX19_08990 [Desulfobacterales bacterium CG23_combo_of_CG06-09_8_20_14_all_51_8]|nr:MAG: hypothetical protein COX19_08990 [Desulfobacterales bacterium CG23_combo_of_CG06-09_8_20_14_all_51_8]